jgi:hypothetical protein
MVISAGSGSVPLMSWVRFVASGAEQNLGGKAGAMPHKANHRRQDRQCYKFGAAGTSIDI